MIHGWSYEICHYQILLVTVNFNESAINPSKREILISILLSYNNHQFSKCRMKKRKKKKKKSLGVQNEQINIWMQFYISLDLR